MLNHIIDWCERGLVPDVLVRIGIRYLCKLRLRESSQNHSDSALRGYINELKKSPIALNTNEANDQHYELPAEFFRLVLGTNLKYSSGFWSEDCRTLDDSESEALELTLKNADLKNGQNVLELGCGWGSLSLYMACKYPQSNFTAISNSHSQRQFIESRCREQGIRNLKILTRNVAEIIENPGEQKFDRIVSVEMFEHLRNYEQIMRRASDWLTSDGKMLIHIFRHMKFPYLFATEGEHNWMGRYFFTGGQMPSRDLFRYFQSSMKIERIWDWNGKHYQSTAEAWLQNMDRHKETILKIFSETYGESEATRWYFRWRIFFLAVSELFGFSQGSEWGVSHYLFSQNLALAPD